MIQAYLPAGVLNFVHWKNCFHIGTSSAPHRHSRKIPDSNRANADQGKKNVLKPQARINPFVAAQQQIGRRRVRPKQVCCEEKRRSNSPQYRILAGGQYRSPPARTAPSGSPGGGGAQRFADVAACWVLPSRRAGSRVDGVTTEVTSSDCN